MFLFDPAGISSILNLPQSFLRGAGITMLVISVAYLAVIITQRGPIALGQSGTDQRITSGPAATVAASRPR